MVPFILTLTAIFDLAETPVMTRPAVSKHFTLATYAGTPFTEPHVIPGRLLFAHFDRGGEGVAHHNQDAVNHSSGQLNTGPEEKNHFREYDGISTSYTKAAFDRFKDATLLPPDMHYVGWTFPGQWLTTPSP